MKDNVNFIGISLIIISAFLFIIFFITLTVETWDFLTSKKSHNFKDITSLAITGMYGVLLGSLLIWISNYVIKWYRSWIYGIFYYILKIWYNKNKKEVINNGI